jgi:hypothetical protein
MTWGNVPQIRLSEPTKIQNLPCMQCCLKSVIPEKDKKDTEYSIEQRLSSNNADLKKSNILVGMHSFFLNPLGRCFSLSLFSVLRSTFLDFPLPCVRGEPSCFCQQQA